MHTNAEIEVDEKKYANLCMQQIELLASFNKNLLSQAQITDTQVSIIHNNASLIIRLKNEYDNNV